MRLVSMGCLTSRGFYILVYAEKICRVIIIYCRAAVCLHRLDGQYLNLFHDYAIWDRDVHSSTSWNTLL